MESVRQRGFPEKPEVGNPPANAGDTGSVLSPGTGSSQAAVQLSPHAATGEVLMMWALEFSSSSTTMKPQHYLNK